MQGAPRRDVVHYPETDHMGEGELQRFISEVLRPLLARFLAEKGRVAHVGADTFLYWVPGDPTQRVAPDVYVLPGVVQERAESSYQLWELGVAPSFCLEIVSRDVAKDYEDAPSEYAKLGVKELVIFDPGARAKSKRRFRFQVFRRSGSRFARVEATQADRVHATSLGAWIRAVGAGPATRLRLGVGPDGRVLVPTDAETADAERTKTERALAEKTTALAEAERQRARAEALLLELEALKRRR